MKTIKSYHLNRLSLSSVFLFASLFLFSCQNTQKETIDLLVKNATIYTVNDSFDTVSAFVIKDGKFVAIGDLEYLEKKYKAIEVFDAEGKTIVPGLIDAHAHLYGLGKGLQQVDLIGTKSFDEVLERVIAFQKEKNMPYIIGRGWDQNVWTDKEFPTNERLDEFFPDIPVSLRRVDGHALLANSKALELAGITPETKVPGGEVVLKNGKLTGVLIDNPMELVFKTFPEISEELSIQALLDAETIALSYGLTSIGEAGLDRNIIELIEKLQKENKMKLKIYAMISYEPSNIAYYLKKGIFKTDRLNVRSFKVYADGALGSRGAALRKPYSDQHHHFGAMVTPPDSLIFVARQLAAAGFQMNTHAIGDSATLSVIKAYQAALQGQKDKRWRVEHAQVISPEGFDYFNSDHNILASVQPTHATSDMYWAEDRLGPVRIKGAYAYQSLLKKSSKIALGTDFPVEQVNPMLTFYAAVARKDIKDFPEGGFYIEEALSRQEALRGMTIWAAFFNFEEKEKGSIEVGKHADFTILDKDLMTVTENELPYIRTTATFINGGMVFKR